MHKKRQIIRRDLVVKVVREKNDSVTFLTLRNLPIIRELQSRKINELGTGLDT